VTSHLADS